MQSSLQRSLMTDHHDKRQNLKYAQGDQNVTQRHKPADAVGKSAQVVEQPHVLRFKKRGRGSEAARRARLWHKAGLSIAVLTARLANT